MAEGSLQLWLTRIPFDSSEGLVDVNLQSAFGTEARQRCGGGLRHGVTFYGNSIQDGVGFP